MTVIPTQKWLMALLTAYKKANRKSMAEIQCEIICTPLVEVFLNASPEEIHFELLQNGLFKSGEIVNIEELEKKGIWDTIQIEYERLKELWSGPEVPIYIFPITKNAITNKNGIAYRDAVFLFVSPELEYDELRALFAHEYNHVCRLHYLNRSFDDVTLKDSLLLEGLAECAVQDLYGEQWLAPWLKLYTMEELLLTWQEHFLPSLDVQGVQNHFPFLYGVQLQKWVGYCIGYEIVRTYKKNYPTCDLYVKSTDELLAGSDFPIQ